MNKRYEMILFNHDLIFLTIFFYIKLKWSSKLNSKYIKTKWK